MNVMTEETPIINAILHHVAKERVSLHVPGHHHGRVLPQSLDAWVGQASKLDVTELEGLDNLHGANGCILESQQLTAAYYGARDTFYSVNGSTSCVMAAVAACVEATGKRTVIVLGPCHVSLWRALVHADAIPRFVSGKWSKADRLFNPVPAKDLEPILAAADDVACVFVTSPSYQGRIADVRQLTDVAHSQGVPLVVDEAHGAHFSLHPSFPQHSVACGADIVVQSPHKTLPCLTQAAWVHVQGSLIRSETLKRHLLFLQSTSPSYILMAAIDAAQAWLRSSGRDAAERLMGYLAEYIDLPKPDFDPARIWIPMHNCAMSESFDVCMKSQGIFLEYADTLGTLAIFGLGQPQNEIRRFFETWRTWESTERAVFEDDEFDDLLLGVDEIRSDVSMCMSPREVFYAKKTKVKLAFSEERIAATPIVPYPPGVPCVWPGEKISAEQVELLQMGLKRGEKILGLTPDGQVEVVGHSG